MLKENKNLIEELKSNKKFKLVINDFNKTVGYLKPITFYDSGNDFLIENLMNWRNENINAYLSHELATFEGTRRWLSKFILDNQHKVLFIIYSKKHEPIGHLGLTDGLNTNSSIEIDNIVRGVKSSSKGIMSLAVYDLISWVFLMTNSKKVYLRVFSDNNNAIKMYERLKFKCKKKFPLKRIKRKGVDNYSIVDSPKKTKKYFLLMELDRNEHFMNYSVSKNW